MLVRTRAVTFSPTSGLCFDTGDGYFKAPLRTLLACKGVYPSSEELLGSESAGRSCSEEVKKVEWVMVSQENQVKY